MLKTAHGKLPVNDMSLWDYLVILCSFSCDFFFSAYGRCANDLLSLCSPPFFSTNHSVFTNVLQVIRQILLHIPEVLSNVREWHLPAKKAGSFVELVPSHLETFFPC